MKWQNNDSTSMSAGDKKKTRTEVHTSVEFTPCSAWAVTRNIASYNVLPNDEVQKATKRSTFPFARRRLGRVLRAVEAKMRVSRFCSAKLSAWQHGSSSGTRERCRRGNNEVGRRLQVRVFAPLGRTGAITLLQGRERKGRGGARVSLSISGHRDFNFTPLERVN